MHRSRDKRAPFVTADVPTGDALLARALVERAVESLLEQAPDAARLAALSPLELLDAVCTPWLVDAEPLAMWAMLSFDATRSGSRVREPFADAREALIHHALGLAAQLQSRGAVPAGVDAPAEVGRVLVALDALAMTSRDLTRAELVDGYLAVRADLAARLTQAAAVPTAASAQPA